MNDESAKTPFQDRLATIIIVATLVALVLVSGIYMVFGPKGAPDSAFNALLPMFATWIGTILAFYFGSKNFESASRQSMQLFNRLSPEVLDDIQVDQIMIGRKTMIARDISVLNPMKVADVVKDWDNLDKSRLPILQEEVIAYIAHISLLRKALSEAPEQTFEQLLAKPAYADKMKPGIKVRKGTPLEKVRAEMKTKPEVKDVFVEDEAGKLVGWLTDTLIFQYLNTKD
ncbi:MAG: hypothetical protein H6581_17680 [Bacteroidia bacterium]|nr:hypothetical protein [Bacteroidia bacterium]